MPGTPGQYFAYIAYDLDLFEEGSIADLTALIIGNVLGFKPLKVLRLEYMRMPPLPEDLPGPGDRHRGGTRGAQHLRPAAARGDHQPKLGPSGRNYGRVGYEALKGGIDFTKDDETSIHSPSCPGGTATWTAWRG